MLYFLFFLVLILGAIFRKSQMYFYCIAVYIFVVMGLNTYNPDYNSYLRIYENPAMADEEIGYRFLCWLGNSAGLSYDAFHLCIVVIGLILMISGIRALLRTQRIKYVNLCLSVYMLFPMMFDIILVRSFVASCIIIYSLQFLMKRKYFRYVAGTLLATSIHISSAFFLLLLLAGFIKNSQVDYTNYTVKVKRNVDNRHKKWLKWIIVVGIVLIIVALRGQFVQNFLLNIGYSGLKVSLMLSGDRITFRKILVCIILHAINFMCYFLTRRNYIQRMQLESIRNLDRIVYTMNLALLVNIVFTVYSDQFLRLLGVGITINSIYYTALISKESQQFQRLKLILLAYIPALVMFAYRMFMYVTPNGELYIDYVFKTILDNNFLVRLFN